MRLLDSIRERRLIPFLGSYIVAGFLALEAVDQLVGHGFLPEVAYKITLIFYLAGLPATAVVAWFHGAKGTQRMPAVEKLLLSVIALVAIGAGSLVIKDYVQAARLRELAAEGELDLRRIAVLYFDDVSNDQQLGYVADGFTEALIDNLDRVGELEVISRNGVGQYRGADIPVDSIARALRTGTVIEGTVDESGENLRVSLRLVDGASGVDFERAGFELPADELLAARDSVAGETARLLRGWLGEEVRLREQRAGTDNVQAWALVQRAERRSKDAGTFLDEGDADGAFAAYMSADTLLTQAQTLDSSWAEPAVERSRIAYEWSRLLGGEPIEADQWIQRALAHANHALDLDPNNPDAFDLRGTLKYWRWLLALEPDPAAAADLFESAEADLQAAVQHNPGQATSWSVLSHLHTQKPDRVGSKLAAQRAYEEDAYLRVADGIVWRLFTISYDLEQFVDAIHWCEVGHQRFPDQPLFVECKLWLMTTKAMEPDIDEAWQTFAQLEEMTPDYELEYQSRSGRMLVAAAAARAGMADSARHLLEASRGDPQIDPAGELLTLEAFVRTFLGDSDESIRLLRLYRTYHPEHESGEPWDTHWWWREIRDDPRFRELAQH